MTLLVVVSGLPAVGKSTIAQPLARHLQLALLELDRVEAPLLNGGVSGDTLGWTGYDMLTELAGANLAIGQGVLLDSVAWAHRDRARWAGLARRHSATFRPIEVVCSDVEEHRRRLAARSRDPNHPASITWSVLEEHRDRFWEPWAGDRLTLDSLLPVDTLVANALEYVTQPPATLGVEAARLGRRSHEVSDRASGASSHLVVAALVRTGGEVLLVRQEFDDGTTHWSLPGGMFHEAETLTEALRRELREETGLEAGPPTRLLYVVQLDHHSKGERWTIFVLEVEAVRQSPVTADPDGLVREARWINLTDAEHLLSSQPDRFMREPIVQFLNGTAPAGSCWIFGRRSDEDDELVTCLTP